jgi:hypothetical protein
MSNPSWSASSAGQTPSSTGFQSNFTRSEATDLATGATISGFRTSLLIAAPGAAATANVLCFNASASFSTALGHTITTHSRYDSSSLNNAATITTFNGLNIAPITGTGTVGTYYGVRLQANTVSTITNRWGISQEDTLAINYFAGNVGIGTASPASKLDVAGTITCDDAGTGLKLPATPGNADTQTLDAYNQNTTWTPTVTWGTGGTVTTTSATGAYTQIGNVVTATVTIVYNCSVVPTGGAVTIDLPRPSATGFNQRPGLWAFNSWNGVAGSNYFSIGGAATTATLRVANATGVADVATYLTVTASGALVATWTYLAS